MKTKKIIKKFFNYSDPILEEDYQLKVEEANGKILVSLPEERSFFRGIDFKEKVQLEKLKNGKWIKILRASFGAGAEELLGVTEINDEDADLEARDIRIIAVVEKLLAQHPHSVKVKKSPARVTKKALI